MAPQCKPSLSECDWEDLLQERFLTPPKAGTQTFEHSVGLLAIGGSQPPFLLREEAVWAVRRWGDARCSLLYRCDHAMCCCHISEGKQKSTVRMRWNIPSLFFELFGSLLETSKLIMIHSVYFIEILYVYRSKQKQPWKKLLEMLCSCTEADDRSIMNLFSSLQQLVLTKEAGHLVKLLWIYSG